MEPSLLEDRQSCLDARMLYRLFDNFVALPQQKIVLDRLREPEARDPHGVGEAGAILTTAYRWPDKRLASQLQYLPGGVPARAD